jgi:bacteriocin-like protein
MRERAMSEDQGNPSSKNQKKAKKPATRMTKKVDFELTEEDLAKVSGGHCNAPTVSTPPAKV